MHCGVTSLEDCIQSLTLNARNITFGFKRFEIRRKGAFIANLLNHDVFEQRPDTHCSKCALIVAECDIDFREKIVKVPVFEAYLQH